MSLVDSALLREQIIDIVHDDELKNVVRALDLDNFACLVHPYIQVVLRVIDGLGWASERNRIPKEPYKYLVLYSVTCPFACCEIAVFENDPFVLDEVRIVDFTIRPRPISIGGVLIYTTPRNDMPLFTYYRDLYRGRIHCDFNDDQ